MKRKSLLIVSLIFILLLITSCNSTKEKDLMNNNDVPIINNRISIDYSTLDEDIFSDLSKEEIDNLFMDISNEIYEDEDYEKNLDSIIENVFRKYGINDSDDLEAIKSGIKISKSKSNSN